MNKNGDLRRNAKEMRISELAATTVKPRIYIHTKKRLQPLKRAWP